MYTYIPESVRIFMKNKVQNYILLISSVLFNYAFPVKYVH